MKKYGSQIQVLKKVREDFRASISEVIDHVNTLEGKKRKNDDLTFDELDAMRRRLQDNPLEEEETLYVEDVVADQAESARPNLSEQL
jgi:hypothetical protein